MQSSTEGFGLITGNFGSAIGMMADIWIDRSTNLLKSREYHREEGLAWAVCTGMIVEELCETFSTPQRCSTSSVVFLLLRYIFLHSRQPVTLDWSFQNTAILLTNSNIKWISETLTNGTTRVNDVKVSKKVYRWLSVRVPTFESLDLVTEKRRVVIRHNHSILQKVHRISQSPWQQITFLLTIQSLSPRSTFCIMISPLMCLISPLQAIGSLTLGKLPCLPRMELFVLRRCENWSYSFIPCWHWPVRLYDNFDLDSPTSIGRRIDPKTRNRIFSTALQTLSHHHILVNLPTSLQTRASVLHHTIAHCNLSFYQRTSATSIRIHTMYLNPFKEDTGEAYFKSSNRSQRKSSPSEYIF